MVEATPPSSHHKVGQPPADTVTELAFNQITPSVTSNFLAATSWDNALRIWEVQTQPNQTPPGISDKDRPPLLCHAMPKVHAAMSAPLLSTAWYPDSSKIFVAGCDKAVSMIDLRQCGSGSAPASAITRIGTHDAPVKVVRSLNEYLVVSGSWDKTLKYWDIRSPAMIGKAVLNERCFAMDALYPYVVVATANPDIVSIYDVTRDPSQPVSTQQSKLKFQASSLAIFPGNDGYAVGSIEGKAAIYYFGNESNNNFSFKCHRNNGSTTKDPSNVFPVNSIATIKSHKDIFATAGSDGAFMIWHRRDKVRCYQSPEKLPSAVTSITFNSTGSLCAYATGYNWDRGSEGPPAPAAVSSWGAPSKPDLSTNIYVFGVAPSHVNPPARK